MNIGLAQVDITPRPGGELCGFAARIQPSLGRLDPLFAKALFLTDGRLRLLWIHCDLIGFDATIVADFRTWARTELGLAATEVMLSATHTHSGPATIHLQEAGRYDEAYIALLHEHLRTAARTAIGRVEPCTVVSAEGHLDLAIDRRRQPTSHTDPRVTGVGFRRDDGTFAAVILNYAIHPVALGSTNRAVSADVMGRAADALSAQLPGNPLVLATNGACGNLNPPREDVPFAQVVAWGRQIADAIAPGLVAARPAPESTLTVQVQPGPLPLDVLDPTALAACAEAAIARGPTAPAWQLKYRGVVERWRDALLDAWHQGTALREQEVELFAVDFGPVVFLGINAEIFSRFTDAVRQSTGRAVCVVGYANGNLGYLPTRAAYAEGGYEVDDAHLFYGGYRFRAGALELLEERATCLLRTPSTRAAS